ncbi:MAG: DEAD/DEAH box helicase [Chloroflexi bacterium]|nr:DEAD/DEAH box helicase [Chloroflexota bacterium]
MHTPMPHQDVGVDFCAARTRAGLFDGMGAGKCAMMVWTADRVGAERVLVVNPASVNATWRKEFLQCQRTMRRVTIMNKGSDPIPPDGVVIGSYDIVRRKPELLETRWPMLVVDEAHFCKSPSALRSQFVMGLKGKKGLVQCAERAYLLTGTPTPNFPHESWMWLQAMAPEYIQVDGKPASYRTFKHHVCRVIETPFGEKVIGSKPAAKELANRMRDNFFIKRRMEDILENFPPIRYEPTPIDGDIPDLEKNFDGMSVKEILMASGLDLPVATLRRETELAKVDAAIRLIETDLNCGMKKVVVFAYHTESLERLMAGLRAYNPVLLDGRSSPSQREHAVDAFQTNPVTRVFLGQHLAAGTGLTLHAGGTCTDVVFVSADWTPGNNQQAAKRVHRIGQPFPVRVRFLHLVDSLDERIAGILASKTRVLDEIYEEREMENVATL